MDLKLEASADGRPFVWAVAVGRDEQSELLALTDDKTGRNFIPVFVTKDDGRIGMKKLVTAGAPPGEIQAMPLDDLAEQAFEAGLGILVLDEEGHILGEFTEEDESLVAESGEDQSE